MSDPIEVNVGGGAPGGRHDDPTASGRHSPPPAEEA